MISSGDNKLDGEKPGVALTILTVLDWIGRDKRQTSVNLQHGFAKSSISMKAIRIPEVSA
jgi:hypothetical protein